VPPALLRAAQVRVYTKKVGHKPDFGEPVVLTQDRGGTTMEVGGPGGCGKAGGRDVWGVAFLPPTAGRACDLLSWRCCRAPSGHPLLPARPPCCAEPLARCLLVRVQAFCRQIHNTLLKEFKYALVWGRSTKHSPQRVGLSQQLADEDVVQVGAAGGLHSAAGAAARTTRQLACCAASIRQAVWQHTLLRLARAQWRLRLGLQIVKNKILSDPDALRGRFKQTKDEPAKISDRVKKAPLKT